MHITQLLQAHAAKDLLRLVTAGSVDDGKSTLIGRLLYETKGIYEDQLAAVREVSGKKGSLQSELDFALITDGLKAEREQGITIDVAYRYFSTPRRKFIIADTPGHEQYTRNTATGASTANLMLLLIDATRGVLTQSKRHAFIGSLLGISHLLVAVNKMDLVDYDQKIFEQISTELREFAAKLEVQDITFVPISALQGDNVVVRSLKMPWYQGTTLLNHLETVHISGDQNLIDLRLPVQYVMRATATQRYYLGSVASGVIRPGETIMVLPAHIRTQVKSVYGPDGPLNEASPPMAVSISVTTAVDISRGDMLVHEHNLPCVDHTLEAMVLWMSTAPLQSGQSYILKHTTNNVAAQITKLHYRIDVNTLHRQPASALALNEIGRVVMTLTRPLAYDPYHKNRVTGAFILIDRFSKNTVGAGMIIDRKPAQWRHCDQPSVPIATAVESASASRTLGPASVSTAMEKPCGLRTITPAQRAARLGQQPVTIWLTGLSGAGKATLARALEQWLFAHGYHVFVLDSAAIRAHLSCDLGGTAREHTENIRRASAVAHLFNQAGLICICALRAPRLADREQARQIIGAERFLEVYLNAPLAVCQQRKPELYAQARQGIRPCLDGAALPYEPPPNPGLVLPTDQLSVPACVQRIVALLQTQKPPHD